MATRLLPLSNGVYGADLGPDSRDVIQAAHAFGPNRQRLARLKHAIDSHNVLAYACPLPKARSSCLSQRRFNTRVSSISDVTKREYATATGADFDLLLNDRSYKEQHREALTAFFQQQVRDRHCLPEEHFMQVAHSRLSSDVLFITGMKDDSPVATFSHLVPHSKLLEIRVTNDTDGTVNKPKHQRPDHTHTNYIGQPKESTEQEARRLIIPFFDHRLQKLSDMVHISPDFPEPGIEFHDILGITQQPRGLLDCTRLMTDSCNPAKKDAIVCCESGGFIFGSPLSTYLGVPLALVREAGKLPPPVFSVMKEASFISLKHSSGTAKQKVYEMGMNAVPRNGSVIVVDDVLSSGETLVAMLQLLQKADVPADKISVIVGVPRSWSSEALAGTWIRRRQDSKSSGLWL